MTKFDERRDDKASNTFNIDESDRRFVTSRRCRQCVAYRWHFSDRRQGRMAGWPGE